MPQDVDPDNEGDGWDIPVYQYTCHGKLGEGSYGVVKSYSHQPSGELVAIKRVPLTTSSTVRLRALRELRLLYHFDHENIVTLHEVIRPPHDYSAFDAIYLVLERMPMSLYDVVYGCRQNVLPARRCRNIAYQILCGLEAIHSVGVLHRDLKPANVLVDGDWKAKICDFGLARPIAGRDRLTAYVASRYYRAPEIVLTARSYGPAVDMWSVGCILGDMMFRDILFRASNSVSLLHRIFEKLGNPSWEDVRGMVVATGTATEEDLRRARDVHSSLWESRTLQGKDWRDWFPARKHPPATKKALSLLFRLLTLNPHRRIAACDALNHPYFRRQLHQTRQTVAGPVVQQPPLTENTTQRKHPEHLRRLIYDEILHLHKPTYADVQHTAVMRMPSAIRREDSPACEGTVAPTDSRQQGMPAVPGRRPSHVRVHTLQGATPDRLYDPTTAQQRCTRQPPASAVGEIDGPLASGNLTYAEIIAGEKIQGKMGAHKAPTTTKPFRPSARHVRSPEDQADQ
ncbi:mitogen activated protein kinase [Saxophila tyrrhenica]|uniref:Mitogen activated protein kinase n=1 Tax=Saxophila tyrrhenica TaxID=1690608 RepID=A0AAV9NU48_9PEZI|nr:mitogen activated protein kinase [Saxophila tyrrhenica]